MKFSKEKTEQIKAVLNKLVCKNCEDYTCIDDNPKCWNYQKAHNCKYHSVINSIDDALEEISIILDD